MFFLLGNPVKDIISTCVYDGKRVLTAGDAEKSRRSLLAALKRQGLSREIDDRVQASASVSGPSSAPSGNRR